MVVFFSKYWEDVYACNRKFSRVVARVEQRGIRILKFTVKEERVKILLSHKL